MRTLLIALLSILLSVGAQFALKAGVTGVDRSSASAVTGVARLLASPQVLAGFLLYGIGALVWLAVLARWDVSKAYPLVGLGFAMTVIVGALQGEQVNTPRMLGVAMICAGVLVVGRS